MSDGELQKPYKTIDLGQNLCRTFVGVFGNVTYIVRMAFVMRLFTLVALFGGDFFGEWFICFGFFFWILGWIIFGILVGCQRGPMSRSGFLDLGV